MTRRVYCWRTGAAFELEEGEACDECGSRDHREVPPGTCGCFVAVPGGSGGLPCVFPPGHAGRCGLDREAVAAYVMEE